MSELIRTRQVCKHFQQGERRVDVLRDVDFSFKAQEVLAIVGPSGAGKSTLLHVLGGLEQPSAGEVLVSFGPTAELLTEMSEARRARIRCEHIGYVFQMYHLMSELSAVENAMLPGRIAGCATQEVRARAETWLADVGLADRMDHYPNQLSGGELQRVAIARALINQPQALLCDEPTGNLDSKTGADIAALLLSLREQTGIGVLLVTHDERLAKRADRVMHMRDGRLTS